MDFAGCRSPTEDPADDPWLVSFRFPLRVRPRFVLPAGGLSDQEAKKPGFTVMSFNCWHQRSRR
jgi:hypothetical protein